LMDRTEKAEAMLKIVEEVTTVYRVLDAADRLIRELPTEVEAQAFKLGFEHAMPAWEAEEEVEVEAGPAEPDGEVFEDTEPLELDAEQSGPETPF